MLKSCPFCGSALDHEDPDTIHPSSVGWKDWTRAGELVRTYVRAIDVPPEQRCYEIHCTTTSGGCGANMSGDTKTEAIDRWNRRI